MRWDDENPLRAMAKTAHQTHAKILSNLVSSFWPPVLVNYRERRCAENYYK